MGWRPYTALFPMGEPARFMGHPVFAVDFNRVSPNQIFFVCGQPNDLHTTALKDGGATEVTPRDFRMLGVDGSIAVPLEERD